MSLFRPVLFRIVSWKDIDGKTTLTASAVGAKSPLDVLKRVVRGDIHLYAKEGSFSVPIEWLEGGVILQFIHYQYPVMVNKEKFYDYVDVEIDIETKAQRLIFGDTIIVDVSTAKFTFVKENKSFNDLANASKFLLALGKYKFFSAGDLSLKIGDLNLDNTSQEEFRVHIEIDGILRDIGLNSKKIINTEKNTELRKQLFLLWQIANHRKDQFFNDKFTLFDWSFCGKMYPLVIIRNDGGNKNGIYGFLYTSKYQTYCESEEGEHYALIKTNVSMATTARLQWRNGTNG